MYISVLEASKKFNLSKRRVQVLCEQGRIDGAMMISGVWVIPATAQKPTDARMKHATSESQLSLFDDFDGSDCERLNIHQVCELLSVSQATIKNWIRLGKLKTDPGRTTFDKAYIEKIILEIKSGKDGRLKSRRNKKNISGKVLYNDYIKSSYNKDVVEKILNSCDQISENELRIILANFAIQLYQQDGGNIKLKDCIFQGEGVVSDNIVFNSLITDLLANVDMTKIDFANIQKALGSDVELVPGEDTLGFIYISLRDLSDRKQTGSYYTPQKTVSILVNNLKKHVDINNETFCDPCCGTGNFLVGLAYSGAKIKNLFGQDVDDVGICITRINMFLLDKSFTKEQLYSQFVCNDTLSNTFPCKFSVVLGNPPWGYNFTKEEIDFLTENYTTAKNKGIESYDLFVEKGLTMIRENGYLAYVLPEAILSVSSHHQVRELMVKKAAFKFVTYLGNAFTGVQCPSIVLGLQNGHHGESKGCRVEIDDKEFTIGNDRKMDASSFTFNMNDEEYDCLNTIISTPNSEYLANNAKFALGIVTGNNKKYITNTRAEGFEVILKGSDIFRYATKETDNYICFAPEKFQQVAPTELYRAKEKLLYRFIAEVPVFTYDNQQTLSLNSCNILIPLIKGMNIKYILAILNSSVAAYFMCKKYNSVKLLKSHIESLPIPMIDSARQMEIIEMVDRIMTSKEEEKNNLYEELDTKIMDIYALSEQQICTIHTALSRKNRFLTK